MIVYYSDDKPVGYALVIEGIRQPDDSKHPAAKKVTFKAACALFPAIRKRWNADGRAKE